MDKAIELADPKSPFLPECYLNTNKFFVGRDKELAEIEEKLKTCNELYVSGVGGIGKSELVRQYAKKHRSEFDSVICVTFADDVKNMLASIDIVNINFDDNAKVEDRLQEKLKKLREFKKNGEKILFIIDNFNTELQEDEENKWFKDFLACTEKTIVTTRNTDIDGKLMVGIGAVENAREIFDFYYKRELNEKENNIVNEILNIFQGHTLATELLAKQMMASRFNPAKMFERLESKGLRESGKEKVKHGQKQKNAYSFLKEIFDVAELSEDYLYVLVNLSLIIPTGISAETFHALCDLKDYEDINYLTSSGWINWDKEEDVISMHPLIAEVMLEELEKNLDKSSEFLDRFTDDREFDCSEYDLAIMCCDICRKIYRLENMNSRCAEFVIYTARNAKGMGIETHYIKYLRKILLNESLFQSLDVNLCARLYKALGWMYSEISYYSKAIVSFEESLKYNLSDASLRCELLDTYNELINSCIENRNFKKAEEFIKQSRIECKEEYKNEPINSATMYESEAQILEAMGEYDKAEHLYLKSLKIKNFYKNEENSEINVVYNLLGNFYSRVQQFDKSEKYYRLALDKELKKRDRFGNVITIYRNLSDVLVSQGKLDEANEILYKALIMTEEFYGLCHPETAESHNCIGHFYAEINRFDDAIKEYDKALKILIEFFDNELVLEIALIHFSLGVCYENIKNYKISYREYKYCVEILEILGEDYNDLAQSAYDYLDNVSKKLKT